MFIIYSIIYSCNYVYTINTFTMANTVPPSSSSDSTDLANDNDGCTAAGGGATLCSCIISGNKKEKSTLLSCDGGRNVGATGDGAAATGGGATTGGGAEATVDGAILLSTESRENVTFFSCTTACCGWCHRDCSCCGIPAPSGWDRSTAESGSSNGVGTTAGQSNSTPILLA